MKSDLWIVFAVTAAFLGFLMGYGVPPVQEVGLYAMGHGGVEDCRLHVEIKPLGIMKTIGFVSDRTAQRQLEFKAFRRVLPDSSAYPGFTTPRVSDATHLLDGSAKASPSQKEFRISTQSVLCRNRDGKQK